MEFLRSFYWNCLDYDENAEGEDDEEEEDDDDDYDDHDDHDDGDDDHDVNLLCLIPLGKGGYEKGVDVPLKRHWAKADFCKKIMFNMLQLSIWSDETGWTRFRYCEMFLWNVTGPFMFKKVERWWFLFKFQLLIWSDETQELKKVEILWNVLLGGQ